MTKKILVVILTSMWNKKTNMLFWKLW